MLSSGVSSVAAPPAYQAHAALSSSVQALPAREGQPAAAGWQQSQSRVFTDPGVRGEAGGFGGQPSYSSAGPSGSLAPYAAQPAAAMADAVAGPAWQQQASAQAVRPETAAPHERLGGAAALPAAARSLSFDHQEAAAAAAAAATAVPSPLDSSGYNPRASLPQPYHLTQSFRASPASGTAAGTPAAGDATPGCDGGGPGACSRLGSSGGEGPSAQLTPQASSALKAQRAAETPFGNEETLQVGLWQIAANA